MDILSFQEEWNKGFPMLKCTSLLAAIPPHTPDPSALDLPKLEVIVAFLAAPSLWMVPTLLCTPYPA